MKTPQEIVIPDGMKLEQKDNKWYFVPIEETLTSEEKLIRCQKMIEGFNKKKGVTNFINSTGGISNSKEHISFNHGSKNLIKAELIQMTWRRLALKLNKGVVFDFDDSSQYKYYACFNNSRIQRGFSIITNSGAVYFTEQAYDEALELIGEENLVFMFNNLNKE